MRSLNETDINLILQVTDSLSNGVMFLNLFHILNSIPDNRNPVVVCWVSVNKLVLENVKT